MWQSSWDWIRNSVFKTLVARGDKNGIHVFCIPVREELDLKKAAAVTDNKKVELVHVKELLNLTGYIRGAGSPIGMKKEYPVTIEETAVLFDTISISAGVRGGPDRDRSGKTVRISGRFFSGCSQVKCMKTAMGFAPENFLLKKMVDICQFFLYIVSML